MGLRQNILTDPVSELNLRQVITVEPDSTIRQVIAKMRQGRLGCVAVVSAQGKFVGKFTERKLMRLLLESPAILDDPVQKHLIDEANPIVQDAPIGDMISRMQTSSVRFLTIVDKQGKPVAISGQKGMLEYIADHFPRQVKVQRMKSKMFMDQREGA